jgi:hypothetical protein
MSLYRIEVLDSDYTHYYIDPFTGEVFVDEKTKAAMVCFMLNDQRPNYRHVIKEVKN